MPLTLCRYILGEILRVFGLTTLILVVVIAFGAAIKPLANNSLLEAAQTVKYVALATIPMLQFAIPFAAGFASTLVMHRLVGDNEVLACRAAGISYRQILLPIIALGLILTLVMVTLTQAVIPRFWEMMRSTIETDMTTLFETSLNRGQPFQLGDVEIFAEHLVVESNLPAQGPDTRMRLWKVAAAELDDDGRIVTDVTAAQAVVDVYRRDDRSFIKLKLLDTVAYNHETGEMISTPEIVPDRPLIVPNVVGDDPMFMSRAELLRLRANPDTLRTVEQRRVRVAELLQARELARAMGQELARSGEVTFAVDGQPGRRYVVRASGIDGVALLPESGPDGRVVVVQVDDGQPTRQFVAVRAQLLATRRIALADPQFELMLEDVQVISGASGVANQREQLTLPGLIATVGDAEGILDLPSDVLLPRVAQEPAPGEALTKAAEELQRKLIALDHEITGRLMKRYALSLTAMLLLLLGATLAMALRNSQPLTVYLWAFLPSILDLILISGGEQMTRDGEPLGPIVLWSGNAVLAAFVLVTFLKLSRR